VRHTNVEQTLDLALATTGVKQETVRHRSRLLSENGSAYISIANLAQHGIRHTFGAPYLSQIRGKIEHYHRSI
jgi:putative transposase